MSHMVSKSQIPSNLQDEVMSQGRRRGRAVSYYGDILNYLLLMLSWSVLLGFLVGMFSDPLSDAVIQILTVAYTDPIFKTTGAALVGMGYIILINGLLTLYGVYIKHSAILEATSGIMVFIMFLQYIAGTLGIHILLHLPEFSEKLMKNMNFTVRYSLAEHDGLTDAFKNFQHEFKCCGSVFGSLRISQNSSDCCYIDQQGVCYQYQIQQEGNHHSDHHSDYEGCETQLMEWIAMKAQCVTYVTLTMCLIHAIGLIIVDRHSQIKDGR